jgi:hypothetical protein
MKKTRLLEIIREEISGALNEAGLGDQIAVLDKQIEQATKQMSPIQKKIADLQSKKAILSKKEADLSAKSQSQLEEEKRKQLAEKYQLDEDTINEMASVVQTKKALAKLGDEKGLKLVTDTEKETLAQFKKNPIVSSDGRLARKLEPEEVTGKRDTRGYGADFERNFKKNAGMDFLDFTTKIDIELKNRFPEEKFTPGLATNTTEKDAANQITGKEPGQRGRKADPNKPEKAPSTGKRGRPAGPSNAGKAVTLTPGDDGFDTVTYNEPEEDEALAAVGSDETAKELGQMAPSSKDENFDRIRAGLMKKAKAAKGELSAADAQLVNQIINTAKEKYKFNATQVDALRAVAGL